MSEKLIRIYKKYNVKEIQKHLLIYGDLSASCGHCNRMGLGLDAAQCPECHAEFQYAAFRNVKAHFPKIQKLISERPQVVIVDFEDYQRTLGALKAEEFLK